MVRQLTLKEHIADTSLTRDKIGKNHYNIGYVALDVAQETNEGVTLDSYKKLKNILDASKSEIKVESAWTRESAVEIFKQINGLVESEGLHPKRTLEDLFVNRGFEAHTISCTGYSLIFLSVAETIGLPLQGVSAPSHLFVTWTGFDKPLYWDQSIAHLEGKEIGNDDYMRIFNIKPIFVENGTMLHPLSREQVFARVYVNKAIMRNKQKNYNDALMDLMLAEKLDPRFSGVYFTRGISYTYDEIQDYEKAMQNFTRAIEIYPRPGDYAMRAGLYLAQNEPQKALADLDKGIALCAGSIFDLDLRDRPDLYKAKAIILKMIGDEKGFEEAIKNQVHTGLFAPHDL